MRKILVLITLTLISVTSYGQWLQDNYQLNFENPNEIQHVSFDTIHNSNNIWQIGKPQKSVFINSLSQPNAILTDTINHYPPNDTSIFIITNVAYGQGFEWPHTVVLSGNYNVHSDTLTDYGKIEFSPDNGNIWIDLLNDSIYSPSISWYPTKPILTGNSNGWLYFSTNIAHLGPPFGINDGDTILYKFTFISDSIQTNKDGLMFDDFEFIDAVEGIDEILDNQLIEIFPNPVKDQLTIRLNKIHPEQSIQIINSQGQIIYDNSYFCENFIEINNLDNGLYFLRYSSSIEYSIKKIIVNH